MVSNQLIHILMVGWVAGVLSAKEVKSVVGRECPFERVLLQQAHGLVLEVVGHVLNPFAYMQSSSFMILHKVL